MKQKTLIEKLKHRKSFLERQIEHRIEPRVNHYKSREDNLSKHGFRTWGTEEGRIGAKEMEIAFLEELIELEEKKIKERIQFVKDRIVELDEHDDVVGYDASDTNLPIGAHVSYGLRVGELQSKTWELKFLESLVEEGKHGSSEGTV
ncbi:hypothetical protein BCP78_0059 [Bacillus phage BCP78]|uniref:Uncharacterized protein n=3 Tax=Tsarbombavirus BCP78 TaxID=1985182 RepID=J9PRX3_9CAUD|nr:hypothetical protein BCP78_0059 [Bacillus phage BCP78]YP_009783422.1 hypothetical protein QLX27_gp049 [Bacillus phage BCU4]AEW47066.1 hypothetical protein BCP78_0059 [Bacillus phage BCP78]AEW47555.1 hypothetical protein BCU4_0049 [Bacillus phage BCU4]AQN32433.1 hypothetical protein BCP12_010 [Bacillus phage BCP12]